MATALRGGFLLVLTLTACDATPTQSPDTQPSGASASGAAPRPHIVLIMADDMGWGDVGFHGSEIPTPNIDRLAAEGVELHQFYVLPVCTPTRAAFLTGRYPIRYGLQKDVLRPGATYGLPVEERTLAQALKEAGYRTAICGKWHLGHYKHEFLPQNRGFDHQYGCYLGNVSYFTRERMGRYDWHRNGKTAREDGYATDLISDECVRLIRAHDSTTPLFLFVSYTAPHGPLEAKEKDIRRLARIEDETRRTYAAMVACMDDGIGRILAALDERGLRESTLVVFLSDNGGIRDQGADNGELRRGKRSLAEGGIRVPAAGRWPGRLRPGTRIEEPLHIVDWFPTLVRLAGGDPDRGKPLDGRDAWPTIARGAVSPHEDMLFNVTDDGGAIRRGPWKLRVRRAGGQVNLRLFDIPADPTESNNLVEQRAEIAAELRARLERYEREAVKPLADTSEAWFPPEKMKVWGPPD